MHDHLTPLLDGRQPYAHRARCTSVQHGGRRTGTFVTVTNNNAALFSAFDFLAVDILEIDPNRLRMAGEQRPDELSRDP
ncbi:hypothetical protein [Cellulomonas oligotrophica]|uniref:Uncharacterized protein n=1 Tax=Cellulomonas oligotrophica TaxID=931536 RepID=A0A7Y9K175_9CELL|nr:hypothetical protein [Cellulomonas oligotrophica]NYD88100.1 hypothetical protein [Cellulomonas oligotrophica]